MITSSIITALLLLSSGTTEAKKNKLSKDITASESIASIDKDFPRVAAFGTSITYGTELANRGAQSYLKLISSKGVNLGIRSNDLSYSSLCAQSMIGDKIYDVIIVEFGRKYRKGLEHLVKRLRKRFPDALIIVARMWNLMHINVKEVETDEVMPLTYWLKEQGFETNDSKVLGRIATTKDVKFSFDYVALDRVKTHLQKLVTKYNVHVYEWEEKGSTRSILTRYIRFISNDYKNLSEDGHKFVAKGIRKIITNQKSAIGGRSLGEWEDEDLCKNWINHPTIYGGMDTNGVMKKVFLKGDAFYGITFNEEGFIGVNNPYEDKRQLIIAYLTSGTPHIFPKVQISISGSGQPPILVNPTIYNDYKDASYTQASVVVGLVNPGENYVFITPLQVRENLFQVVGYGISNESHESSVNIHRSFKSYLATM